MDYMKLLFAAEVRRLAQEMLVSARQVHLAALPKPYNTREVLEQFDADHPFREFLKDAYHEILNTSKFIESQES
jgi:hypothetical protein